MSASTKTDFSRVVTTPFKIIGNSDIKNNYTVYTCLKNIQATDIMNAWEYKFVPSKNSILEHKVFHVVLSKVTSHIGRSNKPNLPKYSVTLFATFHTGHTSRKTFVVSNQLLQTQSGIEDALKGMNEVYEYSYALSMKDFDELMTVKRSKQAKELQPVSI